MLKFARLFALMTILSLLFVCYTAHAAVKVSGPYVSHNMTVFLIHGPDKIKGANILTLEEALSQKKVVVRETGNVNELTVENLSTSVVFLQSGDILKGGRQDRAVQYDMLLSPHSGKVALSAFCVEHGRWSKRGSEDAGGFASSANVLAGKELKLAAKNLGDQDLVWSSVSSQQHRIASSLPAPPPPSASPSSFALTMEQPVIKQAADEHIRKISNVIDGKNDVIGYAFAINGKINSADIYASNELFKKLWPRLLKSSAVEAVAEKENKTFTQPSAGDVTAFLDAAADRPSIAKTKNANSEMTEQVGSRSYAYKTRWNTAPKSNRIVDSAPTIHENYLAK
jgi:hypothetical protein